MRVRTAIATTLVLPALFAAPQSARADLLSECRTATHAEARLAACSKIIESATAPGDHKAIAYRIRGRARTDAGALEQAIADLGEAIRLAPSNSQSHLYRGLAHLRRKDHAAAIADYDTVIRLNPRSAIGYNGRGHAHLVSGNAGGAIADFTAALEINPGSATAHNNRGLAFRAAGDLDRALDDFTAAVYINPIYALAYNNRAYVHEAAGRKPEAIADFRRALMIDPALTGARDGLARLDALGTLAAESERLVAEGKALVETHCKACHAIGPDDESPHRKAPAFRSLHAMHPMLALREPLTRGIAAPHDEMPKFKLPDAEIDKIIAYINSLEARR